ncbi:hypothetical protein C1A50_4637 [Paenibacillus polymyxa]|nr:hypothetical protein C1A50_4637 [Paenibacillus polymyxa]
MSSDTCFIFILFCNHLKFSLPSVCLLKLYTKTHWVKKSTSLSSRKTAQSR